jgi:hypothetical protein
MLTKKVYLVSMFRRGFNQEILAKRIGCVISGETGERDYQELFKIKGYRNKYLLHTANPEIPYSKDFYEVPHKYIGFRNPLIKRKITSPLGGFFVYSRRFIKLMDKLGFKDYRTEPVWVYLVNSASDLDLHYDEIIKKYKPHKDLYVHMRITIRLSTSELFQQGRYNDYEFPLFFIDAGGEFCCNTIAAEAILAAKFKDVSLHGGMTTPRVRKLKRTWRTNRGFARRRAES